MTMMTRRSMSVVLSAAALMCAMTAPAWAQAPQEKPTPPLRLPAKVDVVISRYQGDKKISSYPYTLMPTANSGATSLRLTMQAPIGVSTTTSQNGDKTTSMQYQSVGTNIDCRVSSSIGSPLAEWFDVMVNLNDSSLFNPEGDGKIPASAMAVMSFSSNNTFAMKSGQTILLTTATNKVTGEVIKVEVTFTLIK